MEIHSPQVTSVSFSVSKIKNLMSILSYTPLDTARKKNHFLDFKYPQVNAEVINWLDVCFKAYKLIIQTFNHNLNIVEPLHAIGWHKFFLKEPMLSLIPPLDIHMLTHTDTHRHTYPRVWLHTSIKYVNSKHIHQSSTITLFSCYCVSFDSLMSLK